MPLRAGRCPHSVARCVWVLRGAGSGMGSHARQRRTLILHRQMKQAVERQNTVDLLAKIEAAHIAMVTRRAGKRFAKKLNHGLRAIKPGDLTSVARKVKRNRIAAPATHIKHPRPRQRGDKPVQSRLLKKILQPVLRKGPANPLIGRQNIFWPRGHWTGSSTSLRRRNGTRHGGS